MPRTANPLRALLWGGQASVLAMLGIAMAWAVWSLDPSSALLGCLSAGCVFLGLVWIILGYLCAPNMATYLGPGALPSVPIFSPKSAIPESNAQVLEDLGEDLSRGTDLGIAIEALGAVLILMGILAYIVPRAGILVFSGLCVTLAALVVAMGRGAATSRAR